MAVDYSKGKIYKIVCNTTGLVYVGSTSEPTLARRLSGHVRDYKCWLNGKGHFVTSFKVLENGTYEIVLIESYPCNSKDQLHARERYWCNKVDCVNKYKNQGLLIELGQKQYNEQYNKQYRENNKEYFTEHNKQYRENNKEYFTEHNKQYRENNKEIIKKHQKQYYEHNKESFKEYKKQYYEHNKESFKEYKKQYYEHNKEKLNQKSICECGGCYYLRSKARHIKNEKHQHYEQNRIYYIIRKGLDLIKAIDQQISN